ncbi:hypothetical protein HK102_010002 [Quaeritorhiza haematococci]|nr:hypothetical protein HK102_010002 [Quaeritorhiza haematococci]
MSSPRPPARSSESRRRQTHFDSSQESSLLNEDSQNLDPSTSPSSRAVTGGPQGSTGGRRKAAEDLLMGSSSPMQYPSSSSPLKLRNERGSRASGFSSASGSGSKSGVVLSSSPLIRSAMRKAAGTASASRSARPSNSAASPSTRRAAPSTADDAMMMDFSSDLGGPTAPLPGRGGRPTGGAGRQEPGSDLPLRFSSDLPLPSTPAGSGGMDDLRSPLMYPSSTPRANRQSGADERTPRTDRSGRVRRTPRSDIRDGDFVRRLNLHRRQQQQGGQLMNRMMMDGDAMMSEPSSFRSFASAGSAAGGAGGIMMVNPTSDPGYVQKFIWGTTIDIQESMYLFRDFLLHFTRAAKLEHLGLPTGLKDDEDEPFYPHLMRQMKDQELMEMNLDCENLKAYTPAAKLYHQLVRFPQEIIPMMDFVLSEVFFELFEDYEIGESGIKVRPFNLDRTVNMRQLDPTDIDQLVTVKGMLIRTSPIIPDLKTAFFQCTVCHNEVEVHIDRGSIEEPTKCSNEDCKSQNTMRIIHNRCQFTDKQVLRMQETPEEIPDGQTPYTFAAFAYDDLVDVAKPGDRLEITGIYRAVPVRINPRRRAIKSLLKTYLDVVHIKRTDRKRIEVSREITDAPENLVAYDETDQIRNIDPEEEQKLINLSRREDVYEFLARSVAPSIFGMEDVKKGILLQLFSGTNKFGENQPNIRGDINILLVGDPGVSKSQMLQYVHQVAPRGVYTSGKGSSAVGLTAYVTRDPDSKQLVLERVAKNGEPNDSVNSALTSSTLEIISGALVLSDGGICCIDEFDKMSDSTRSVLHEVMEQQTISVAKAGIITTLNARTSILASANPIGSKFDEKLSLVSNINLPPTLISRFDLIYLILDKAKADEDERLARHLVSLYLDERPTVQQDFLSIETFTKYVNYARTQYQPTLSEAAADALVEAYVQQRQFGKDDGSSRNENVISATTRQLESMIRLAEAHAKMRFSPIVETSDVEEANRLIQVAIQRAAIDPRTGRFDLDLINTGIGSRDRTDDSEYRGELKKMFQSMNRNSIPWAVAYRQFCEICKEKFPGSNKKFSEFAFDRILADLSDEDVISIKGQDHSTQVIWKIA